MAMTGLFWLVEYDELVRLAWMRAVKEGVRDVGRDVQIRKAFLTP